LPRERGEDERDEAVLIGAQAYHFEGHLVLIIASGSEEGHKFNRAIFGVTSKVLRWERKQPVAPGQWIAHDEAAGFSPAWPVHLEKDAAVADVAWSPVPPFGLGDEGVGEIGGFGKGTSKRCGGVGRLGGVESGGGDEGVVGLSFVEESKERRRVAFAEAAEEGALGDDAVETGRGD